MIKTHLSSIMFVNLILYSLIELRLYFWLYGGILYKIYILERKRLPDENLVS